MRLCFLKCKVVDVDNVRLRATVKVIPRIDLQALSNKLVCVCNFLLGFIMPETDWAKMKALFYSILQC